MQAILNYSGDQKLDEKISFWLQYDRNEKTRKNIEDLIEHMEWKTLGDRLLKRLEFGTAGLRGVMQSGFNSVNDLVIIQTAQGLCQYTKKQYHNVAEPSIVIGYDGRFNSKRFAELTASIFIQNNFKVYLYSRMVATPYVPFAILRKKCHVGVMVTASHNPKEDNGYKVYWGNGAQIISPHDKGIQHEILKNLTPVESSWNTDILKTSPLLEDPYDEMLAAYSSALLKMLPQRFLETNQESNLKFVYTAMHGVGYPYVREAFQKANLNPDEKLLAVAEQRDPDPTFPTVPFPNPEEGKSALELAMQKADKEGVSIILANDPDADRLALAVKDEKNCGEWKVFNGNELGALIGWWVVYNYKELHPNVDLKNCYLLASTVSSKILQSMGKVEGYNFIETLTGFKWMGNRAIELMAEGKEVLFAFEEAIGYMFSTNVLDKDGVSAACHLATMASYLQVSKGLSLIDKLNEIYDHYGFHCTNCSYLFCYEKPVIDKIFNRLRHFQSTDDNVEYDMKYNYPKSILDNKFIIENVRDLTVGYDSSQPNGKAILPVSSSSQMITFTFTNGLVITLRTSGTEPKIKYYAELCAKPDEKDYKKSRETLNCMVDAIVNEFLQPKLNNLTAKAD